jgi:uncharacterized protein YjbI with pentapeptide repeats
MTPSEFLSRYAVQTVDSMWLRDQQFDGADFTDQRFDHLRLHNCQFKGCRFDLSRFVDLRVWGSSFQDCSFRKADLRDAALGGLIEKRHSIFENTQFTGADLRGSTYISAVFDQCGFENAKLNKVDFDGSRFIRCRFAGELRETSFADVAFDHEELEPNRMVGVDFSKAALRWVAFRRLDLSGALLPQDQEHVVFADFREFLTRALKWLEPRRDLDARKIRAVLEVCLRHAPKKGVGLLNRLDFREEGESCGALFDELVRGAV